MWGREVTTAAGGPEAEDEASGADVVVTDDDLFARLYPALRRFASVVGPAGMDPDDLVQEAVGRTLRRGPLTALDDAGVYLRRAIVNLAANERRRQGRWRRARARAAAGESPAGEPASYPSDVADLLRLRPETRATLWLVDVEGWTFDEVAALLGATSEAVRARASRARRSLRQTITEEQR